MNQDGNQSLNMFLNKEIECLHDDGFDGSVDEHRIFKEVFFGKDSGKSNKKCLVTGVINFEIDHCKKTNLSVHSNSDNSALTSQEEFTVKRMKLSVDKLSNTKPKSKGDVSHSIYHPVTCRLVESSSHGVTSSCYLLKRHVGDRNELKEANASKAIASPVSQESYASKQLVAFPLFNDADKPRSLRLSKPRWKDSCFMELDIAEMKIPRDSTTDPRPLLRYHIHCLLRGAGWVIGKRKRAKYSNVSGEYVYRSPEGRPIREFRRAWILCGQSLFAYDTDIVIEDSDCKQWIDLAQFFTDLSNTLAEIKEQFDNSETTASLAHWWYLLDPFANVVFIDKTMGLLKEGKRVKAKRSLVIDSFAERDGVLALKDVDSTVFEEDYGTREEHCGSDITCDQTCTGLFEVPITFETQNIFSETGSLNLDNEGSENDAQNENSHFTNDIFTESHNSERTYMQLNTCESASQLFETPIYVVDDASFDAMLKGNSYKKSKKMYEVELTTLYQSKNIDKSPTSIKYEPLVRSNIPGKQDSGQKNSMTWHLKDDDLLISAIIKNKKFKSPTKMSSGERVSRKSRKCRTQKGSCRLLPRSGGKLCLEGSWSFSGTRTVLSWLINSGFISLNEVIEYRNPKDDSVVKEGLITWEGILCRCCDKVLSVSEFKIHAGFRSNRPCLNLFLESGKPITLCQLEAWSAEYKARKSATRTVQVEDLDQNDDSCGLCGDGGELICCDNCPSTFHQTCMYVQELPEGSWYCPHCTCRICGDLVIDEDSSQSPGALKCLQCEHKYHAACLLVLERERGLQSGAASDSWFCTDSCQEVYSGLQSRIGIMNSTPDGFCWTLLRCIHGDQKVHSAQRFVALKAECNLKLAVALTIMEECFLPMVDPRTGIDMIPHVLYNWGSEFARLNYHGFQTVVLEKDDVLMSVAAIRIHGVEVAEMPLIATCSKYRRQGMCRRLMKAIEEMLKSFKVEKLVISAIPSLVETWTNGFGFEPLEDNDKSSLSTINLMVFPGTIWLKKRLINHHIANQQTGHPTETGSCFEGCPTTASDGNTHVKVDKENEVNAGGIREEKFTKTSFEEPASTTSEGSQVDISCHLESMQVYDDRKTLRLEKSREEGGSKIEVGYNLESVQVYDDIKLPLSQHSRESDVLQGK